MRVTAGCSSLLAASTALQRLSLSNIMLSTCMSTCMPGPGRTGEMRCEGVQRRVCAAGCWAGRWEDRLACGRGRATIRATTCMQQVGGRRLACGRGAGRWVGTHPCGAGRQAGGARGGRRQGGGQAGGTWGQLRVHSHGHPPDAPGAEYRQRHWCSH